MPNRSAKPSPPAPREKEKEKEGASAAPAAPTAPPPAPVHDLRSALERIIKSCPKDLHAFLGNATPEQLQEYHAARTAGEMALRADALRKR